MLSSIEAVAVSAASPSVSVLNRQILWSGGVISINVPPSAKEGEYPSAIGPKKFVKFAQGVKGGVVNFFVHDEDPARFCGKQIIAGIEIWQKTLVDGRKFLYVDLDLAQYAMCIPNRIAVMSVLEKDLVFQDGMVAFETPSPLQGVIVVARADGKILTKGRSAVKAAVAQAVGSTGDKQLDRYLADGWVIKSQNDKVVHLTKEKGGETKRLAHLRPQQQPKTRRAH
ncbi:MAG: hypothetical protein Q8L52_00270 [bacterium]|nr:hypothetical protein [bacterium]